ncbi:MAG: response regulator [Gemmatimonadota bacterium]|nr:response regulator [Gemmatimonadota bacterium]
MSTESTFGNWMVAITEAAEVAGAPDLDSATVEQMGRAWDLVGRAASFSLPELAAAVAHQARLPVARLDAADRRAEILIPAEVAHRRNVLPLGCSGREVDVATANPLSQEAKREIAKLTGRVVRFQLAEPRELNAAVEAAYGPADRTMGPGHLDASPNTGPHVLVVDDEAGQRELFRSVLEEDGYRVTVAKDGPTAMQFLRAEPFDLMTLDYWMDKMNGLRVLQSVRAEKEIGEVPVIMVTGAEDRRIEMSLFEAGADDFIAKPIDPPLFLLRVQAVLRRRRFA